MSKAIKPDRHIASTILKESYGEELRPALLQYLDVSIKDTLDQMSLSEDTNEIFRLQGGVKVLKALHKMLKSD